MTGDSHSNDDADFLDEDFVIEDIVGKNDDLEDLFDEPAHPVTESSDDADLVDEHEPGDPDEDDLLFSDHTEGIMPSEEFVKPVFAEEASTEWDGEELDLESVGVPDMTLEEEEEAADPQVQEAKASFATELSSLLSGEAEDDDYALDSEAELELIEAADGLDDGISEFEQSGPFILDDGEGLWSDEMEETVAYDDDDDEVTELPADELQPEFAELDEAADEVLLEEDSLQILSASEQLVAEFEPGAALAAEAFEEEDELVEWTEDDEEVDALPLLQAAAADAGTLEGEAGWEPLPRTSMDKLSEVDEVQRTDDQEYDVSGYEEDEVFGDDDGEYLEEDGYEDYAGVASHGDLEDVDGHDIYAEDGGPRRGAVLGGPGNRRSRTASLLLSLAASFVILFGAATVIVRPEWFGLSVEPERVAKVDIARPKVEVAVLEPPRVGMEVAASDEAARPAMPAMPAVPAVPANGNVLAGGEGPDPLPSGAGPASTAKPANPAGSPIATNGAANGDPGSSNTANSDPTKAGTAPSSAGPAADTPTQPSSVLAGNGNSQTEPTTLQPPTTDIKEPDTAAPELPMVAVAPPTIGSQPEAAVPDSATQWPVAQADPETAPTNNATELQRFGTGLMVGAEVPNSGATVQAIEGVMPGSRAFAQLHNGNYFIGQVKHVATEAITLRVDTGEVTLATADIAQLTRLGSTDYDELQKATKGFVRLTNNNRLVGGILSKIADDHIVLEFRSNRVMLPKSAIGEIVQGKDEDGKIRLGTTSEEDSWVRSLAERELGTGHGAPIAPQPGSESSQAVRSGPPR